MAMADALATFDDSGDLEEISRPVNYTGKARFSGQNRHWGISPSLARAKPALAPKKPQPPVAAVKAAPVIDHPVAPPAPIGSRALPVESIYRVVGDLEGLQDAFADRI